MSDLDARLRDEIDDQVAETLEAYLAERETRRARRTWPLWLAIVLTNVAWLLVVVSCSGRF